MPKSVSTFNFDSFFQKIIGFAVSSGLAAEELHFSNKYFKIKRKYLNRQINKTAGGNSGKNACIDLNNIDYKKTFSFDLRSLFYHHDNFELIHRLKEEFSNSPDCIRHYFGELFHSEMMLHGLTHEFYRYVPLNGLKIEFSREKRYFKTGEYPVSQVIKDGEELAREYSSDSNWTDLIGKILDALKGGHNDKQVSFPNSENVYDIDRLADDVLNKSSENSKPREIDPEDPSRSIDLDNPYEFPDDLFSESRDPNSNEERNDDPQEYAGSRFDNLPENMLDNLPENMPEDIRKWVDKVKNIERWHLCLGEFCPSESPLKIVMYTETIKQVAEKESVSELHLFESVLAHEFFHALHFTSTLFDKLDDSVLFVNICRSIKSKYNSNSKLSRANTVMMIWAKLQNEAVKHWYSKNARKIASQVLEPLAVAFQISWIKDRLNKGQDITELDKMMKYELRRFGNLSSYPSDPYCGAKYLIANRKNHKTMLNNETIITNISVVLKLSLESMDSAYRYIQNMLMW
jgi:hypothetical protein